MPNVCRLMACFCFSLRVAYIPFSLSHLLHIFSLKPLRASIISMTDRGTKTLVDAEDDHNRGWFDRFVAVPTHELVKPEDGLISERWNERLKHSFLYLHQYSLFSPPPFLIFHYFDLSSSFPAAMLLVPKDIPDIEEWVGKILVPSSITERSWTYIYEVSE